MATVSKLRLMSQMGEGGARSRVRVDQGVSGIGAVELPVSLWTLSCSKDIGIQNMSRKPPGYSWDTRWFVKFALCSIGRWVAEVEPWPVIHGGCYHVTEVGGPYGLW